MSAANCTQNTNMDLGLSHILTALCRANDYDDRISAESVLYGSAV